MADNKLRMPSINSVKIAGRLTSDPEVKLDGKLLAFSVAVSRSYKQNDEWKEDVGFYDVAHWSDYAARTAEGLRKGGPVYIEGSLSWRSFEVDGAKRSAVEVRAQRVTPLDWNEDGAKAPAPAPVQNTTPPVAAPAPQEDIPF